MSEITPKDRDRLAQLEKLASRCRHANGLIEQFAAAPAQAEQLTASLRRAFSQLKIQFTTAGFDRAAQICAMLEQTARRGMSHGPKVRALRETLGNLMRQVDLERRAIMFPVRRDEQPT